MLLSSKFWQYFGRACETLFSHYFILSTNVDVLVPFTDKNDFAVGDVSLQGLTK